MGCASVLSNYLNTSEQDSNQRQKHWTPQVLVSRPKQPKSRIIVNPLRPNVFYHILSSVSLLMYKLLSCRVNIEYMSCLILQILLMGPHFISSHILMIPSHPKCSSKDNQMWKQPCALQRTTKCRISHLILRVHPARHSCPSSTLFSKLSLQLLPC